VLGGLTSDRPCVRKGNHPPGPAALAEAARPSVATFGEALAVW